MNIRSDTMRSVRKIWCFCSILLIAYAVNAQDIPTPQSHFGFAIGDDYQLSNYTQTEEYFKKLAASSSRVKLVDIGRTEEDRTQYMLIVTSEGNHRNLEKYKSISQKLAGAEDLSETEAKALAQQGKAIVWIDGGLHSTETVATHQLIETAYLLASRTDEETTRILDDVIILMVHANPDGHELQANWYMREPVPENRTSVGGLPRLYHKYAGHDNNRDFFMLNLKETKNMARQLYIEWLPQIMYNHHQSGPAGTIVAGPPFRDPHNYVFDPIIMTSLDALGAAMHNRLNVENKPGYTQRGGSVFSNWYNGGMRTTTYFHNIIGLLSEVVGSPAPMDIPFVPARILPNGDSANPILPRRWHFKNAIDYSISMNYAVLNYAQRYRDELLFNIYRMGRNSIEKGSKDTWAISPRKIEEIAEVYRQDTQKELGKERKVIDKKYAEVLTQSLDDRDPRGYIIPSDQSDFTTAIRFLNALIGTGIVVNQATSAFTVDGKEYPQGSYVVKTDQAFRPHVLDMFEPQDHPNDFEYEGGPPIKPYDAAGWTLAYLMNVKFDRVLDDFEGPFERLGHGAFILQETATLPNTKGYTLRAKSNASYLTVNKLLDAGVDVSRNTVDGNFYVQSSSLAKSVLSNSAVQVLPGEKPKKSTKIKETRIALWDRFGGTMNSGWLRYLLEEFQYDFTVIYPPDIDGGNLIEKYDVIILPHGSSVPTLKAKDVSATIPDHLPEEYRTRIGNMSVANSVPQLIKFLEDGGKIVAMGNSAMNLVRHLDLPVKNFLATVDDQGKEKTLGTGDFFIPGSVLQVQVDTLQPASWGLDENMDVYFNNSPVFKLTSDRADIKPLAWFANDKPLRSGWAWGQSHLKDGVAAFEASYGKGKVVIFGPEVTFRSQSHGTFKWLFNQLYD